MFNFRNTTQSLSSIKFFYIPKYELAKLKYDEQTVKLCMYLLENIIQNCNLGF